MNNDLNCEGIKFPVSKKDYCRLKRQKKIFVVMCFVVKMD